ncbi:MAG: M14 family metallopeptidase [Planctomycetota bacterium]|jgi:predicted deacylase|nr:M14 family metallopeptidase [Planctomycetota bacterium]
MDVGHGVKPFVIKGLEVAPGTRRYVDLPLPQAFGHADLSMPVVVCHGRKPGPAVFVSAAIHGDEIIGTEIIRRLLEKLRLRRLRGTVVAVPVVNAYGFISQQRYLPDRRDLNRCFPGSQGGSLAGRVAHLFLEEIVARCDVGIDLHSGAIHRDNLAQIRADLDDPRVKQLAMAFGTPILLNSDVRDGSLREAVRSEGKPMLLFEGGEALRLDEASIRAGLQGCLNVLAELGVVAKRLRHGPESAVARGSRWLRAPSSGIIRSHVALGDRVREGQVLASIADPTGRNSSEALSDCDGIVIGRLNMAVVNEGDAIYHLGYFRSRKRAGEVAGNIEDFDAEIRDTEPGEEFPIV